MILTLCVVALILMTGKILYTKLKIFAGKLQAKHCSGESSISGLCTDRHHGVFFVGYAGDAGIGLVRCIYF